MGELLLVHARVRGLGTVRPLAHGLRGPRGHRLGLRVGAQRGHDGCSDGGGRGVVLGNLLDDDKYVSFKTCNIFTCVSICSLDADRDEQKFLFTFFFDALLRAGGSFQPFWGPKGWKTNTDHSLTLTLDHRLFYVFKYVIETSSICFVALIDRQMIPPQIYDGALIVLQNYFVLIKIM